MDPTYPSSGDNIFVLAKGTTVDTLYRSTDGGVTGTNITSGLPQPINDIRTSPTAGFLYAATNKGVYARDLEPAMPEGFQATTPQNNHPTMTWTQSQEADIDSYQVFKYGYTSCEWVGNNLHCSGQTSPVQVGSLPYTQTTFVDVTENLNSGTPGNPAEYKRYYVVAKDKADATALVSGPTAPIEFLVTNYDDPEKAGVSGEPVPTVFFMDQNYPNPFNPKTTLAYGLPEDVHVSLVVYDVLGREVATLVNEMQQAGFKSVEFDASTLSSGMYFYKLVAGSFTDLQKMVVAK